MLDVSTPALRATDPNPPVRHAGPLASWKAKRRYVVSLLTLVALAVFFTIGLLAYNNPMPFGTAGFWRIAELRAGNVLVMLVVAVCHGFATVSFQTATANRIITPSLMGFEALYVLVQTSVVFFLGAAGVTLLIGTSQFLLQAGLMVLLSMLLYGWLLSGRLANIHIMLLVGVILGGGLGALSTFMQRLLNPSEFDILAGRLFGNIGNAQDEYLPVAIPIVALAAGLLWVRARSLNVVALGRDTTNNLGLDHRSEVRRVLFLVSVLMAMTTAMVGPMTFLGFLAATLAYQVADTYDHRLILPVAALLAYVVVAGAYFILRNIFYAEGVVTIIIELVGGLVFLIHIMRKGRL